MIISSKEENYFSSLVSEASVYGSLALSLGPVTRSYIIKEAWWQSKDAYLMVIMNQRETQEGFRVPVTSPVHTTMI